MPAGDASWVDRQIREATERGEFDNLPGAGKPLPFLGKPEDEDWWVKGLIERERLDMTMALPPQLALRKEQHQMEDRVVTLPSEDAVREHVEDFNARVRELWRRPLDGPLIAVRTLDVERLVEHWRAHHPAPVPLATPTAPPGRTRWWQRLSPWRAR